MENEFFPWKLVWGWAWPVKSQEGEKEEGKVIRKGQRRGEAGAGEANSQVWLSPNQCPERGLAEFSKDVLVPKCIVRFFVLDRLTSMFNWLRGLAFSTKDATLLCTRVPFPPACSAVSLVFCPGLSLVSSHLNVSTVQPPRPLQFRPSSQS